MDTCTGGIMAARLGARASSEQRAASIQDINNKQKQTGPRTLSHHCQCHIAATRNRTDTGSSLWS